MTSRGQQLAAIERGRDAGIVYLILGAAYLVGWVAAGLGSTNEGVRWLGLILTLAWLGGPGSLSFGGTGGGWLRSLSRTCRTH